MVTFVGYQENLFDAIRDLIELEYSAKEAYEVSLQNISDVEYKNKLNEFKTDHLNHIDKLSELLSEVDEEIPTGPGAKQWLTKGKVVLSSLIGDITILKAMNSNEIDTNSAYEHMCLREDLDAEILELMQAFLVDEKKHKSWLETTITRA